MVVDDRVEEFLRKIDVEEKRRRALQRACESLGEDEEELLRDVDSKIAHLRDNLSRISSIIDTHDSRDIDNDDDDVVECKAALHGNEVTSTTAQITASIKNGDIAAVHCLIQEGLDPCRMLKDGSTLLHHAVASGHVDLVRMLIANYNLDLERMDMCLRTPLHIAAQLGDIHVLRLLLNHGSSVTTVDENGCTPLHISVQDMSHLECSIALVEQGSRIEAKNAAGYRSTDFFLELRELQVRLVDAAIRTLITSSADTALRSSQTAWRLAANAETRDPMLKAIVRDCRQYPNWCSDGALAPLLVGLLAELLMGSIQREKHNVVRPSGVAGPILDVLASLMAEPSSNCGDDPLELRNVGVRFCALAIVVHLVLAGGCCVTSGGWESDAVSDFFPDALIALATTPLTKVVSEVEDALFRGEILRNQNGGFILSNCARSFVCSDEHCKPPCSLCLTNGGDANISADNMTAKYVTTYDAAIASSGAVETDIESWVGLQRLHTLKLLATLIPFPRFCTRVVNNSLNITSFIDMTREIITSYASGVSAFYSDGFKAITQAKTFMLAVRVLSAVALNDSAHLILRTSGAETVFRNVIDLRGSVDASLVYDATLGLVCLVPGAHVDDIDFFNESSFSKELLLIGENGSTIEGGIRSLLRSRTGITLDVNSISKSDPMVSSRSASIISSSMITELSNVSLETLKGASVCCLVATLTSTPNRSLSIHCKAWRSFLLFTHETFVSRTLLLRLLLQRFISFQTEDAPSFNWSVPVDSFFERSNTKISPTSDRQVNQMNDLQLPTVHEATLDVLKELLLIFQKRHFESMKTVGSEEECPTLKTNVTANGASESFRSRSSSTPLVTASGKIHACPVTTMPSRTIQQSVSNFVTSSLAKVAAAASEADRILHSHETSVPSRVKAQSIYSSISHSHHFDDPSSSVVSSASDIPTDCLWLGVEREDYLALCTFVKALENCEDNRYVSRAHSLHRLLIATDDPTTNNLLEHPTTRFSDPKKTSQLCKHNLLYTQAKSAVLSGRLPCLREEAALLAGLQLRIQSINRRRAASMDASLAAAQGVSSLFSSKTTISTRSPSDEVPALVLKTCLPDAHVRTRGIAKRVRAQLDNFVELTERDSKHLYVQSCQLLITYGLTFFVVRDRSIWFVGSRMKTMGIGPKEIMFLDNKTKEVTERISYSKLDSWRVDKEHQGGMITLIIGDRARQYLSPEVFQMSTLLGMYFNNNGNARRSDDSSNVSVESITGYIGGAVDASIADSADFALKCCCPPEPALPSDFQLDPADGLALCDLLAFPLELARQMILLEHHLFQEVTDIECLAKASSKIRNYSGNSSNIEGLINRFNQVSGWVSSESLRPNSPKERSYIICQFLHVSRFCMDLKGFNTVMAIISGLATTPVRRLKSTWELVPTAETNLMIDLEKTMSAQHNFQLYREMLRESTPPALPYFGVYLKDLLFIEDGNPDMLSGGLINIAKRRQVFSVLSEIRLYRDSPFYLEDLPEVRAFLLSVDGHILNAAQLHQRSKDITNAENCGPKTSSTIH